MKKCKRCKDDFKPDNYHQLYCKNPECVRQRMNYNNRKSVEKKKKADMCTCCGIRPKAHGFRFLCEYCFRTGGEYEENSVYIPGVRTMFV